MTRQRRRRLLNAKVGIGVPVVAAGALVAALVVPGTSSACFKLSGGRGFTISSVLTAYPSCSGPSVYLYPGVASCLVYTAHNPLHVPITVSSLGITRVTLTTRPRDPSLPACTTAELDLSKASFSGSLPVPALGTNSVTEPVALIDNGANQDNCEAAIFNFVYSGAATYTDATITALGSWPDPSKLGQGVTFTATVSPIGSPPGQPRGTVSFYLCSSARRPSPVLVGSAGLGPHGRASWSTSALAVGTHLIEAVYQSPWAAFTGSSSTLVPQVVQATKYAALSGASP